MSTSARFGYAPGMRGNQKSIGLEMKVCAARRDTRGYAPAEMGVGVWRWVCASMVGKGMCVGMCAGMRMREGRREDMREDMSENILRSTS